MDGSITSPAASYDVRAAHRMYILLTETSRSTHAVIGCSEFEACCDHLGSPMVGEWFERREYHYNHIMNMMYPKSGWSRKLDVETLRKIRPLMTFNFG